MVDFRITLTFSKGSNPLTPLKGESQTNSLIKDRGEFHYPADGTSTRKCKLINSPQGHLVLAIFVDFPSGIGFPPTEELNDPIIHHSVYALASKLCHS